MADTPRSLSDIQTLLADNTTGNISAQDFRDFVQSMYLPFAGLYISSSAETTVAASSTWYLSAGTSTETNSNLFTVSSSNRLTYTGTPDCHGHIALSVSMTSADNNQVVGIGVGYNGTINTPSIVQRKVGTGADLGSAASHTDITMSTNDYLEPMVANFTSTGNLTLDYCYLFIMGMFV